MHLYILTRGVKHSTDLFMTHLQSQYYPYKHTNFGNKNGYVQLGVRPIQILELVLPEKSLPNLQRTLFGDKLPNYTLKQQAMLNGLKHMLGAKKCPPIDPKAIPSIIYKENMAIYPIGIKHDNYDDKGNECL